MNIADLIPLGKENAISRAKLMQITGFTDQHIRKLISIARDDGVDIVALKKGGYYITNDTEEMKPFVKSMENRVRAINKTIASMKKKIAEADGIKFTKVREHLRKVGNGNYDGQIQI